MILFIKFLFLEIEDARNSIVFKDENNFIFSTTAINYFDIPELTGFRIIGEKYFLIDLNFFGISHYNEVKLGIGKKLTFDNISLKFILYLLYQGVNEIKNFGFTEDVILKINYLNYEGGIVLKNLFYLFKDEIIPIEEIYVNYTYESFSHTFKLSYSFENNINLIYGLEMLLYPFIFRIGLQSDPFTPSIGLGIIKGKLKFDFSFLSNPYLGFTKRFTFTILK